MEVLQEEGKGATGTLDAMATTASEVRGDTPASRSLGGGTAARAPDWLVQCPHGRQAPPADRARSNGTVVAGSPSHASCPICSSALKSVW